MLDGDSFSSIQSEGFQYFFKKLFPDMIFPNRHTMKDKMISCYINIESKLKQYINEQCNDSKPNITLDMWKSKANDNYLGLTIHFISNEWKLNSIALSLKLVEDSHNKVNISEWIESILKKWNIDPFVMVVDNASNLNFSSSDELVDKGYNILTLKCSCHTLNLVIKDAVKKSQINPLFKKCKDIVKHFNQSYPSLKLLEEAQIDLNKSEKILAVLNYCSTRWYSISKMLERLYDLKDPLSSLWDKIDSLEELIISEREWDMIYDLVQILGVYKEAIELLEGDSYPTLPWLIDTIVILEKISNGMYLQQFLEKRKKRYSKEISDFLKILNESLKRRFLDSFEKDDSFLSKIACLLNPKTWSLNMFSTKLVKSCKEEFKREYEYRNLENLDDTEIRTNPKKILTNIRNYQLPKLKELDQFLKITTNYIDTDPFEWWRVNQSRYPITSKIARQFLSIPASSAPCERLFSEAGSIISVDRHCLDPQLVEIQTFLSYNGPFILKMNWFE
jgi:hypothetical protein